MFLKKWLEEKLEGKPSGSRLVLTVNYKGVLIIAVGWKYKKDFTRCFIMTCGSRSTAPDPTNPHMMKFRDNYRNTAYCPMSRGKCNDY